MPEDAHAETAKLDVSIVAGCETAECCAPVGKDLAAPVGVGADADGAGNVVRNDRQVKEGAGEVGQLVVLRMIEESVEGEPGTGQGLDAFAERTVHQEVRRWVCNRASRGRILMPCRDLAYAAQSAASCSCVRIEHGSDAVSQAKIGMRDNAGCDQSISVGSAGGHRCGTGRELSLTDGASFGWAVAAGHRAALDEAGGWDVVTACHVFEIVMEEIAAAGPGPEMMMRVDNGAIGLRVQARRDAPANRGGRGSGAAACFRCWPCSYSR